MTKQSSTRSTPVNEKPPRRRTAGARTKRSADADASKGSPQPEEDEARHTEMARELVLAAWPGIVRGLIKKAMSGGYQQTKLLLDLCEITGTEASQANEQRRRQLCDALLEGLGLPAGPEKEASRTDADGDTEKTEAL